MKLVEVWVNSSGHPRSSKKNKMVKLTLSIRQGSNFSVHRLGSQSLTSVG